jgi:hypothetical protein
MDDILIYVKLLEELKTRTNTMLQRLKEHNLFLKLEKCKFVQTEVEFLGLIISEGQIHMDAAKLAGIKDWPAPMTVKQVCSFLGFSNFYRKFIGHYVDIVKLLTELTHKDIPFVWMEECQHAFEDLKEKFLEEPVLQMPDLMKEFIVETDASKWATGAVLKQIRPDGELHPCGYISHTFTAAEQNYQIYDHELLAVIHTFDTWKQLLRGSPHPIIIHCDHKNLGFYKANNKLMPRQACWLMKLQPFDMHWEYMPGNKLIQADALSGCPDHIKDDDEDNDTEYYVLIPLEKIIARLQQQYNIYISDFQVEVSTQDIVEQT